MYKLLTLAFVLLLPCSLVQASEMSGSYGCTFTKDNFRRNYTVSDSVSFDRNGSAKVVLSPDTIDFVKEFKTNMDFKVTVTASPGSSDTTYLIEVTLEDLYSALGNSVLTAGPFELEKSSEHKLLSFLAGNFKYNLSCNGGS